MSRQYYNRYQDFLVEGEFKVVPGIELPVKGTDKYHQYKKGKDRLDKISEEFYNSPLYGWLIMQANPIIGSLEFEIPDNAYIRIPFPLTTSLQDYKRGIELYKLYYGEQ
jgi:hypothetical protein